MAPIRNEMTIKRLVTSLIDGWDMTDLISYATERLIKYYESDSEAFDEDWKQVIQKGG